MFRLFTIVDTSLVMPMRWFAAILHLLASQNCHVRSTRRSLNALHDKMLLLRDTPSLIINEDFMMGMFNEHEDEIPRFKEHIDCIFNDKVQCKAIRDGTKHQPFKLLREELFHLKDHSSVEFYFSILGMGSVTSGALIEELTDKTKATKIICRI